MKHLIAYRHATLIVVLAAGLGGAGLLGVGGSAAANDTLRLAALICLGLMPVFAALDTMVAMTGKRGGQ